jgi:GDP/UDP-N,N'-diacetylbacillosamine 2-epimerase (hydrolysing)
MEPLLDELVASARFDLWIVATGAHLSHRYGYTVEIIERRFGSVERILSLFDNDEPLGRVKGLGLIVMELAEAVRRHDPDILLTLGDREEALATAIVGNYMNVPVVHLGGGDRVLGNVDDHVRHSVTKLAHIHCAFTKRSGQRIIQMGEEPWRVHVTGSPGLDGIRKEPWLSLQEIEDALGIHLGDRFVVLIQHPISSEYQQAANQMDITLRAICSLRVPTVVVYPNSDAGTRKMIETIDLYAQANDFIHPFPNLPRNVFVNLLRHATCLIGNSSAGIHEAPYLRLPVVNIGNRQSEREHSTNVVYVPFDVTSITATVSRLLCDEHYRQQLSDCLSPYGDGYAVPRILAVLDGVTRNSRVLYKDFVDLMVPGPRDEVVDSFEQ